MNPLKFVFVFGIQLTSFNIIVSYGKKQRYCDAKKNYYYRESIKACYKCEKCVKGEGKIPFEEAHLPMHVEYGATQCIPCRRCKSGTFSDKRDFKCKHCRDCKQQERYELQKCTYIQNAVCGDKIQVTSKAIPKTPCLGNNCDANNSPSTKIHDFTNLPADLLSNNQSSHQKAVFTAYGLGFLLAVIIIVVVVVYIIRKRNVRYKQRRHVCESQSNSSHLPLVAMPGCERSNGRTNFPKMSNIRTPVSVCSNNISQRTDNEDTEETNLKLTEFTIPMNQNEHEPKVLNNKLHVGTEGENNNNCKNHYSNNTGRLFGEINAACSSGNSTMKKKPKEVKSQNTKNDNSTSLLPIRSLSEFSYSY